MAKKKSSEMGENRMDGGVALEGFLMLERLTVNRVQRNTVHGSLCHTHKIPDCVAEN